MNTCLSPLDVRKNDFGVCLLSNLINLVKALLGLMLDVRPFKARNWMFEFDHLQMNTFELVLCSKMMFNPSLANRTLVCNWMSLKYSLASKLKYHIEENSGFFCHSDFTWNQFWKLEAFKNMPFLQFKELQILLI